MYNKDNIFTQIIRNNIKSEKIYEDDKVIAIKDINPVAPVHVLVITKGEYSDYSDFTANASSEEITHYFTKITDIAKSLGLDNAGYRVVTNNGSSAGQTIFHFHTHIIGGKQLADL